MDPDGSKWVKIDLNGYRWIQMDPDNPNGSRAIEMDPDGFRWIQKDPDESKKTQLNQDASKSILIDPN